MEFSRKGYRSIAGVDEVGRGCLAGPVVAAAVILREEHVPIGIDDSKRLPAPRRVLLDQEIRLTAIAVNIGVADVDEIDTVNIFQASKLAMVRAVGQLVPAPDLLLIDGNFSIECPIAQKSVVRGDQISVSIAAASIVAKVYRDRLMAQMDSVYPGYEFAKHKGYGSVEHRKYLMRKGPSPIHRKSFTWTPV